MSKCFLDTNFSHINNGIVREFIILLSLFNFIDMMQSMNGIVCWYNSLYLENSMTPKKLVIQWYLIIRVDYARMLLFMFGLFVYWKIVPNSHTSDNTCRGSYRWHHYWFTTCVVSNMGSTTWNVIRRIYDKSFVWR